MKISLNVMKQISIDNIIRAYEMIESDQLFIHFHLFCAASITRDERQFS